MARKAPSLIEVVDLSAIGGGPHDIIGLSEYSSIYVVGAGLVATTVAEGVASRLSSDNGLTFETTNYHHQEMHVAGSNVGSTTALLESFNDTAILMTEIHNFNVAAPTFSFAHAGYSLTGGQALRATMHTGATAMDAIRILIKPTQDWVSGNVYVWGERAPTELIATLNYPLTGDQIVDVSGYANVNITVNAGSASAFDIEFRMAVGGVGEFASGDYPHNRWITGTLSVVDHTTAFSNRFQIVDGVAPTVQRGFAVLHGVDMATPTVMPVSASVTDPTETYYSAFRDSTTAYAQIEMIDDGLNSGTVWITGTPTT